MLPLSPATVLAPQLLAAMLAPHPQGGMSQLWVQRDEESTPGGAEAGAGCRGPQDELELSLYWGTQRIAQ